jgi:hypothetical protein
MLLIREASHYLICVTILLGYQAVYADLSGGSSPGTELETLNTGAPQAKMRVATFGMLPNPQFSSHWIIGCFPTVDRSANLGFSRGTSSSLRCVRNY